jgi:hypothetical protein
MSALRAPAQVMTLDSPVDDVLGNDVLAHLEAQLVSARRLLQVVLEQGAAIRARDVQNVVSLTGLLQAELQRRTVIEGERSRLLERAGLRLGVNPGAVTLTLLERLMSPPVAHTARSASAELRGLLAEVQREHHVNRALMNQELAFLDHLLRLVDSDRQLGYDSAGDRSRATAPRLASRHRVLDLEV